MQIPEDIFNISDLARDAFWNCPKIKFQVDKYGHDCDAKATSAVNMVPIDSDQCFKK